MTLTPFRLERYFARWEFQAPYLLCASDAETVDVQSLLRLDPTLDGELRHLRLGYTDSQGDAGLRHEISRLYARIDPDRVLVHSAGVEAIFTTLHAVLRAGDHVIVHEPCYQALKEVPRHIGCDVSAWRARHEDGWSPDPRALRALVRADTRALVVNFPHNPTGYLPPPQLFDEVVEFAREHHLVLLSDEMYRLYEHDSASRLPAACDLYERAVSLGGVSKALGLAGLRLGWIATRSRELLEAIGAVKDYTTICASAPSELLARYALRHRAALVDRNLGLAREHLPLLTEFFDDHAHLFECVSPTAGPVAFPRFRAGDADALCNDANEHAGVVLLPGAFFDEPEHLRIGFGRADFPDGLERLRAHLASPGPLARPLPDPVASPPVGAAIAVRSIDHVVMTVEDVDLTAAFYERVLGMERAEFGQGRVALRFGSQKLNLHQRNRGHPPVAAHPAPGTLDVCFLVEIPMSEVLTQLRAERVEIVEGPVAKAGAEMAIRSVYFHDPDGNLVELSVPLDSPLDDCPERTV